MEENQLPNKVKNVSNWLPTEVQNNLIEFVNSNEEIISFIEKIKENSPSILTTK